MTSMIKTLVGAAALTAMATAAQAVTYKVEQEDANGDFQFVANVQAFAFAGTGSAFYTVGGASYNGQTNGGPAAVDEGAVSFLVSASDGLSFVTVMDARNDVSNDAGIEAVEVSLSVAGDPDGGGELVNDDSSEFKPTPNGSTTTFAGKFKWDNCCTDGLMVGALDGNAWSLLFEFTENAAQVGSAGWTFADGAGGSAPLTLANDRAIRVSAVPVPAGVLLIGSAFALAGAARRVSRKS